MEVKTAFSHWIKRRLEETMAEEGVDFIVAKNGIVENTLFQAVEYIISLDTAKEIAMLERSEIGKKVRKHFIECEKELQNQTFSNIRMFGDGIAIYYPITDSMRELFLD